MHYNNFHWHNLTFLLADDDKYSHLLLEKAFRRTGVNLVHAYNGIQAVELASTHKLSLAIIDLIMPGLNGYEVVPKVKALQPDVVCVAYTADAMRIDLEYCEKVGFDKCLIKPMLPFRLFKAIDEVLQKKNVYK